MTFKLATTAIVALAVTTLSSVANAEEPRGVDWGRAILDLDRLARGSSERPTTPTSSGTGLAASTPLASTPRPAVTDDPSPQNLGNAWFGVAPRVTIVARDWASSTRLAGDRLSVVDAVRLAQSTRMVVARTRLSNARFTPFLQLGIGQWRVDRNYLPFTPSNIEVAGQVGTGFELRLTNRWQLAAETSMISLIRDGHNDTIPQTVMWSTFLASRLEF